jgi:1,4-dihydroxy-2-naphthoate octaprenyltransferase
MVLWFIATRPKTLVASIIPVSLGGCLAVKQVGVDVINILLLILCFAFALLIQVATNFFNDYSDNLKGADDQRTLGPTRFSHQGLLNGKSLRNASFIILLLAFGIGLFIMEYSGATRWLLLVGTTSVLCALAYTGGPIPFAYNGLGDIFVILFFGFVAVCTTHYVMVVSAQQAWSPNWIVPLGIGFLINNLLVVNNYRDWKTDRDVGKKTLVVLLGRKFGLLLFFLGNVVPLVVCPIMDKQFIAVTVFIPVGLYLYYLLQVAKSKRDYSFLLAGTSMLIVSYGILVGWLLAFKAS